MCRKSCCSIKNYVLFMIVICSLLCLRIGANIVNVDNTIIYLDPKTDSSARSSYFGYSVVLYSRGGQNWIIVGAPRSNSSTLKSVHEPGEVYRCGIKEKCQVLNLDDKARSILKAGKAKVEERKDGSWLGVSLAMDPTSDNLAACAHRRFFDNSENRLMTGSCYVTNANKNDPSDSKTCHHVYPLFNEKNLGTTSNGINIWYYGMGQMGIFSYYSAVKNVNMDQSNMVFGAPGFHNSRGMTLTVSTTNKAKPEKAEYKSIVPNQKLFTVYDGDYFGYSGTSGFYKGKHNGLFHAASAPRSKKYLGQVLIYTFPKMTEKVLTVEQFLEGDKLGTYFGAALATGNFDGDAYDDLLVGAPYGVEPKVHIYYGSEMNLAPRSSDVNNKMRYLKMSHWGRISQFGISLATTDFNHDGYADAIVGAPEANKHGAIAIYLGDSTGLRVTPSQVILANDVYRGLTPPFLGFGMSLAPPEDIDGNTYPDVAIGSYKSSQVVLLRTIPKARVKATLRDGKFDRGQVSVKACLEYSIPNVWRRRSNTSQTIQVRRTIIIDDLFKRAILRDINTTLDKTLTHGVEDCEDINFIIPTKADHLTPLEISLNVKKIEEKKEQRAIIIDKNGGKDVDNFDKWDPRVEDDTHSVKVQLSVDCGSDNKCTCDLVVAAHFPNIRNNELIVGAQNEITMTIEIENKEENAYMTAVVIKLPTKIKLKSMPSSCKLENDIVCDIGNPLKSKQKMKFDLKLDLTDFTKSTFRHGELNFVIEAKTASEEMHPSDNTANVVLKYKVDQRIIVAGKSQKLKNPDNEVDIFTFEHTYEVQKVGTSNIEKVDIHVKLPYQYSTEKKTTQFIEFYNPDGTWYGGKSMCNDTGMYYYNEKSTMDDEGIKLSSQAQMKKRSVSQADYYRSIEDMDTHYSSRSDRIRVRRDARNDSLNSLNDLPKNRTLYLQPNDTNTDVRHIICSIGPITDTQVARLSITMRMNITELKDKVLELKDIIVYISNAEAKIDDKLSGSAEIYSIYMIDPPEMKVELWIIILSIILGLLLVLLVITALIKAGFFKRRRKEELEKLKEASRQTETNDTHELVDDSHDVQNGTDEFDIEH